MAQFSVAARSGGAGSTTLPIGSLYNIAGTRARIREIGVFNTTTTPVSLGICKVSSAGTQGTGLTEVEWDEDGSPPLCTAFDTHSVAPTLGSFVRKFVLASQGAAAIFTFGGFGLSAPVGTANGIAIIPWVGTGQVCDWYIDWEE